MREAKKLAPEIFDTNTGGAWIVEKLKDQHWNQMLWDRVLQTTPPPEYGPVADGGWNGGLTDETSGMTPLDNGDLRPQVTTDRRPQIVDNRKVFVLGWEHPDFSPGPDGNGVFKTIGIYDDEELMLRIKRLLEAYCDPSGRIITKEYALNTET